MIAKKASILVGILAAFSFTGNAGAAGEATYPQRDDLGVYGDEENSQENDGAYENQEEFGVSPEFEEKRGLFEGEGGRDKEEGVLGDGLVEEETEEGLREQEEFGVSPEFEEEGQGMYEEDRGILDNEEGMTGEEERDQRP